MDTEDDWNKFLIRFEEKHKNFFKKLKMLYPQLTNNDLRLCACLKLGLESKDIASLMNISVRAVENNRYR
jgi:FixJ family two-component response regulator